MKKIPHLPLGSLEQRGFLPVLRNSNFLALWLAEIFSTTALNGAFFLQIILVEDVTKSSAHLAAVILAFSLPGVLFSAMAGIIVDRVPKKYILIGSNALRVLTGAALALLAASLLANRVTEVTFLAEIYLLVFLTSAIGQFFTPAEGAIIPVIVRKENLLPANSLFTITLTATQVLGIVVLAPLGVKTIGIVGSLWVAVAFYMIATIAVSFVPRDEPNHKTHLGGLSVAQRTWKEIGEGWSYALGHRPIFVAVLQLSLVSIMTFVMATLAPGYAARVLGLNAEDATVVFWPAGVGILVASFLVGRFGHHIQREWIAAGGIAGLALTLAGLAWSGGGVGPLDVPLFRGHPEFLLSTTALVMIFAFGIGLALATVNIPAQTSIQERAEADVRGRVFAVQFAIANALSIPPMLSIGFLADEYGILDITYWIAAIIAIFAVTNVAWVIAVHRASGYPAAP